MGHFLSTVNPEAAADIRPIVDLVLPEAGDILKFFPRPGEGRGGRTDYFIQVTRVYPDGRVDGIVPYDAADARDVINVPHRSGEVPWPAWEWRDSDRRGTMIAGPAPERSDQLGARMDTLAEALAALGVDATALLERVERLEDEVAGALSSRPEAPHIKRKYVRKTPTSDA